MNREESATFRRRLAKAEEGDKEARYWAGENLYFGRGVKSDMSRAVEWWRQAAAQGCGKSMYELGWCHQFGKGVDKDEEQAKVFYNKAFPMLLVVAEQGDLQAQGALGHSYQHGNGVAQDITNAMRWYHLAAEQGNILAMGMLGHTYETGNGVEADMTKAVEWYSKSAEQGDAGAQDWLGYAYQKGKGVETDPKKALQWYFKAARQGHSNGQNNVGFCYQYAIGVDEDFTKAVEWYRKSSDNGCAAAKSNLAYCFFCGLGVRKDMRQAVEYFKEAYDSGEVGAKISLDNIVAELKASVHRGSVNDIEALSYCYHNGAGVARNAEMAAAVRRHAEELRSTNEFTAMANDGKDHDGDEPKCMCCEEKLPTVTLVHGLTGHTCCCVLCAHACIERKSGCPICRHAVEMIILNLPGGENASINTCTVCGNYCPDKPMIVHGSTGHTSTCWECAQALQANGLGCHVCTQPIDRVVRNYRL